MCGEEGHAGRLYRCNAFKKANPTEQRAQVKKIKACPKCLDLHGRESPCNENFLCRKDECKKGDAPPDHFFLCLKSPSKKDTAKAEAKGENRREPRGPTEEQEAVFANLGLTLEQLEAVRKACTNKVSSRACAGKDLVHESGPKEHPVLMMLVEVTTKRGDWV